MFLTLCLILIAVAGVEFRATHLKRGQIETVGAQQNAQPQIWQPNTGVGDFLVAAVR